jgi:hypothetical protein
LAGPKDSSNIQSFENVKTLSANNDLDFIELQSIKSHTKLASIKTLVLNYASEQYNTIVVSRNEVMSGPAGVVEFVSIEEGFIMPPASPAVSTLVTTFKDCNDRWTVDGHSNIEIKASEILPGCEIFASGGDFNSARLVIDYSNNLDACSDYENSMVLKSENSHVIAEITNRHGTAKPVTVSAKFVEILMSQCKDAVVIESTLITSRYVCGC